MDIKGMFSAIISRRIAALVATIIALCAPLAHGIPIKYEMIIDEKLNGVAVLQGDLRNIDWVDMARTTPGQFFAEFSITATLQGGGATDDWTSTITLFRSRDRTSIEYGISSITGRHITKPAPHPGEASPGPLLLIGPPDATLNAFNDLEGRRLGAPNPLSLFDKEFHDDAHFDKMVATLADLDGNSDSVLTGVDKEIRLRVTFDHVPEPGSLALALAALAALALPWVSPGRSRRRAARS